jgi:hypothetical protein
MPCEVEPVCRVAVVPPRPAAPHTATASGLGSVLSPIFVLAARSPGRQRAFRELLIAHLVVLLGGAWLLFQRGPRQPAVNLGHLLLVAGIVEGAVLIGWRLAQLPKSQALEFLLVSLLPPWQLLLAEALVGLTRLALVTLAGLPVLVLLTAAGYLDAVDLGPLLVMPFTWGAVTGLGLAMWAYEPRAVRRWAERGTLAGIVVYLAVGVLAGENLVRWLSWLPDDAV